MIAGGRFDHMDGWSGWMWFGGVFWLLFLAALVALIVWLVTRGTGGGRPSSEDDRARRILDERFARGEIDEEEYRRRREVLG